MAADGEHRLKVLYFAWLRERTRLAEESVVVPPTVRDVGALVTWLSAQTPGHAAAFANRQTVRCAVNQEFATTDTPLADGDEVAFFPPITGG